MRPARYTFDSQLTATIYRSGQKQELWGRAADISEGGLAATLSETLEVGEIALIRIEIENKTLNLRAGVRYCRGHFCGFEFLAITLDERHQIGLYASSPDSRCKPKPRTVEAFQR